MKIKVRLTGVMSSRFGWEEQEFKVETGTTIRGLKDAIESGSTVVQFNSFHANAAVNRAVTGDDTPLKDGDEVVFLPPLAGG